MAQRCDGICFSSLVHVYALYCESLFPHPSSSHIKKNKTIHAQVARMICLLEGNIRLLAQLLHGICFSPLVRSVVTLAPSPLRFLVSKWSHEFRLMVGMNCATNFKFYSFPFPEIFQKVCGAGSSLDAMYVMLDLLLRFSTSKWSLNVVLGAKLCCEF